MKATTHYCTNPHIIAVSYVFTMHHALLNVHRVRFVLKYAYHCITDSVSFLDLFLFVSEATTFIVTPKDFIMETWDVPEVRFMCNATTDPSVTLKYTWKHGNAVVDHLSPE